MDRRQLLKAGLALPFVMAGGGGGLAGGGDPIFIADMHSHMFFPGTGLPGFAPLAGTMAEGKATLVSWSLVGDLLWLRPTGSGLKQKGAPKPGEAAAWFKEELARVTAHVAEQKLKIAKTPADLDLALKGEPHVVLSVEGASFLDGDIGQLQVAYDQGVRHIQLVHYIRNTIGDFQTERPEHKGLSEFGRKVIGECNRLGILIDLAHGSDEVVTQALAASNAPMVWSHSSVTKARRPNWQMVFWQARQLSAEAAKAIADKGGVIGLWALRTDVGPSVESYADRLSEMADWLGDDHVAFGTDRNALKNPAVAGYGDLRRVVDYWKRKQVSETRIRKIAIGNYARVLRQAFEARQG